MKLPAITPGKIIGLVLLCFVVGFVLTSLGIRPDDFWYGMVTLARWAFDLVKAMVRDGLTYFLVGAAVVLPVYAVIYLWKAWRRKS